MNIKSTLHLALWISVGFFATVIASIQSVAFAQTPTPTRRPMTTGKVTVTYTPASKAKFTATPIVTATRLATAVTTSVALAPDTAEAADNKTSLGPTSVKLVLPSGVAPNIFYVPPPGGGPGGDCDVMGDTFGIEGPFLLNRFGIRDYEAFDQLVLEECNFRNGEELSMKVVFPDGREIKQIGVYPTNSFSYTFRLEDIPGRYQFVVQGSSGIVKLEVNLVPNSEPRIHAVQMAPDKSGQRYFVGLNFAPREKFQLYIFRLNPKSNEFIGSRKIMADDKGFSILPISKEWDRGIVFVAFGEKSGQVVAYETTGTGVRIQHLVGMGYELLPQPNSSLPREIIELQNLYQANVPQEVPPEHCPSPSSNLTQTTCELPIFTSNEYVYVLLYIEQKIIGWQKVQADANGKTLISFNWDKLVKIYPSLLRGNGLFAQPREDFQVVLLGPKSGSFGFFPTKYIPQ